MHWRDAGHAFASQSCCSSLLVQSAGSDPGCFPSLCAIIHLTFAAMTVPSSRPLTISRVLE